MNVSKNYYTPKQAYRIARAKERTKKYEEELTADQQKRIDRICSLEFLERDRTLSQQEKRELKKLRGSQTKEERKYLKALDKEVATYFVA